MTPNGPWVLVGQDHGYAAVHIDPATSRIVATVPFSGTGTSGMVYGHGALWVAAGSDRQVVRIDVTTKQVTTVPLDQPPPGTMWITASDRYLWVLSTPLDSTQRSVHLVAFDIDSPAPRKIRDQDLGAVPTFDAPAAADDNGVWIPAGRSVLRVTPRDSSGQATASAGVSSSNWVR